MIVPGRWARHRRQLSAQRIVVVAATGEPEHTPRPHRGHGTWFTLREWTNHIFEPAFPVYVVDRDVFVVIARDRRTQAKTAASDDELAVLRRVEQFRRGHHTQQFEIVLLARTGRSLESMANAYQVRNLWQILDEDTPYRLPALVTCMGLPVLDLYLAQHVYETARDAQACPG